MEKQGRRQRVARDEEEEEIGDAKEEQGRQELGYGSWVFRGFFFIFLSHLTFPRRARSSRTW